MLACGLEYRILGVTYRLRVPGSITLRLILAGEPDQYWISTHYVTCEVTDTLV